MKKVYTVQFYEEGLRSDGFFKFEDMEQFWQYLKLYANSDRRVTICMREHEVNAPSDVCRADSVKDCIKFVIDSEE